MTPSTLDFSDFQTSEDVFIGTFVGSLAEYVNGDIDRSAGENRQRELEQTLRKIISANIQNPNLDTFLVGLLRGINYNQILDNGKYAYELFVYVIKDYYVAEFNRAIATGDSDYHKALCQRYAFVLQSLHAEHQANYRIDNLGIDGSFTGKLKLLEGEIEVKLAVRVLYLANRLSRNPTEILHFFEDSSFPEPTLNKNLYFLIKNALRRFIESNPEGSDKFTKLDGILNSPFGFQIILEPLIKLIFVQEDYALAWKWIEQFEKGEEIDLYNGGDKELY